MEHESILDKMQEVINDCAKQSAFCRREKMHYSQWQRWDRIWRHLLKLKEEIGRCDYWYDLGDLQNENKGD